MLFVGALALVCTSIVMVVSASMAKETIAAASLRQFKFVAIGLLGMFAVMRTDYHHLRRPAVIWTLLGVTVAGLLAVFAFRAVNGSHRWIFLPGLNMQPSELAKLAAIIFAAAVLERRMHRINDIKYSLLPIGIVTGILALLIVKEPDMGTSTVLVLSVATMVLAAGLNWRYLAGASLLMLPVLTYVAIREAYRSQRVTDWISYITGHDPAYHLKQSLIALGSGGPFGVGLGASSQKWFFLPEANNDFIFSVIGEELGVLGTTVLLVCFMIVAWRGLRAALLAPDRFGTLVGIGLTMMMGLQACIHMSVVTGLAPTKGIPLPFVSSGGSSLVVNMLAMGILLNISQHASVKAAATVNAA
jgi:cell division protein FtsW